MSMPTMTLECDKCGYAGSTGMTHGNLVYKDGDVEIHLRRTLGWCDDCATLVPMEDFSEEEAVLLRLADEIEYLKKNDQKSITVCLTKTSKSRRDHRYDEITELTHWLHLAKQRKGTEKCLRCESTNVREFDGKYHWVESAYEDVPDEQLQPTGFIHPQCGGEIMAKSCPMRFRLLMEPRYYSMDGRYLEQASEQG